MMQGLRIKRIGILLSVILSLSQTPNANGLESQTHIAEAGISLMLPKGYSLQLGTEPDRRGSFASYDFVNADRDRDRTMPCLEEIQFFSRKSIKRFERHCKRIAHRVEGTEHFCATMEYPTSRQYRRLKGILQSRRTGKNSNQLKRFGGREFIVFNAPYIGGTGVYREYRTLVKDMLITVEISMEDESQSKNADILFSQLRILDD